MSNKRYFRIAIGVLSLLVLIIGFSTIQAQDQVTIKFWSHDYASREAIDREIITQFEGDNPNIKVEYTIGPGDDDQYRDQLLTAIAGGEGPDLFNVLARSVAELVSSGTVVPVDYAAMGFESEQALVDSYLAGTLEGFVGDDGELYAVPTEVGNYSLFINSKLFEEAGLDPATDIPTTWEDIMAIAPKLTKKGENGNITQRAFDFSYPGPEAVMSPRLTYGAMAYQLGNGYFNEEKNGGGLNTEGWIKTLTYIRDYAAEFGGPSLTPVAIDFVEGNVAMVISGAWYLPQEIEAKNPDLVPSILTAPFPRWKEGLVNDAGSYIFGYGLYVNSQSSPEVQAASWKLASALTSQPERYLNEALLLQPKVSIAENEELMQSSFAALFISDMAGSPYTPVITNGGELPGILNRSMERVLLEGMDPEESLTIANDEVTALFTQ
jgi:multiple sugar transport system substrate-binding protein